MLKTVAGVRLPQRIFYGWVLVGLVWVIMGVLVGPLFQGMGVFFVALQTEFGWSRTALSLAFSFGRIEAAMLGPIEGLLTDRFGSARWSWRDSASLEQASGSSARSTTWWASTSPLP